MNIADALMLPCGIAISSREEVIEATLTASSSLLTGRALGPGFFLLRRDHHPQISQTHAAARL